MVKVFEGTPHEYYMDGYMRDNLDIAKKVIKQDWDMISVYDGKEGSGKSVKCQQDAFYCDPTINIDRIVFSSDDFVNACLNAKPYEAVIWDEAYQGLEVGDYWTDVSKTIKKMLAEIRERNLFIFIVMPTFFDLLKYVALWRSRWLVHVYTQGEFERGYFSFYNEDRKKDLFMAGKKTYSYATPKPNFFGRFTNHYVVDEAAYRAKKRGSKIVGKDMLVRQEDAFEKFNEELFVRLQGIDVTHDRRMEILSMPRSSYYAKLNKWEKFNSKVPMVVK